MWLISLNTHVQVPQCLVIMSVCMLPAKHSKNYHVISKSDIYRYLYNLFLLMYAASLGLKFHRPSCYYYLINWTLSIIFCLIWSFGRPQLTELFLSLIFFSDFNEIHILIHHWSSHIYKKDTDPTICDKH